MSKPYNHINYKNTELGWIPSDWKIDKMKNVSKVNQGLQIPISERYNEQVENSLFYITNEFLKEGSKDKYFIKNPPKNVIADEDDILMTRTGNTGKVVTGVKGVFHNNFFKIMYDSNILFKDFLVDNLRGSRIQYKISILAGNSTIPDLNHSDFYSINILIPPLPEQQKIAQILSTWDKAIAQQEQLIAQKRQLKKGMMQQLLTAKLRFPGFEGEWEMVKLGEILDYEQPTNYIVSSDVYLENADKLTPVLTANKSFILGYTNETKGIYIDFPIILFDDFTTDNKWVDFQFKVKSSAIKILKLKNQQFNLKYVFEKIQLINFPKKGHKRYYISEYQYNSIICPNLKEQQKIAQFLTAMDAEIEILQTQLTHLQTQKQGLMQVLLTGEIRVKV